MSNLSHTLLKRSGVIRGMITDLVEKPNNSLHTYKGHLNVTLAIRSIMLH